MRTATLLLCFFFTITAHAGFFDAPELNLDNVQCPPGDRTDWRFDPKRPVASHYLWKVTNDMSPCPPDSAACAGFNVFGVGVIRSSIAEHLAPTWLRTHELCHLKGWVHDSAHAETALSR